MQYSSLVSVAICTFFSISPLMAQQGVEPLSDTALSHTDQNKAYSPYAERSYPERPLWGDAHVHTNLSTDAGLAGNRLSPSIAYQFARGEEIQSSLGQPARLSRPLDWLVLADHSDGIGMIGDILSDDPDVMAFEQAAEWGNGIQEGGTAAAMAKTDLVNTFSAGEVDPELIAMYAPGSRKYKHVWEAIIEDAEAYNEPGRFTAMIGYEWTSVVEGNNLHRVVILRDGGDRAQQVLPMTMTPPQGSPDPRDLWTWMRSYEEKTGGEILAIPHNGNLSNGIMFPLEAQWNGQKFDESYLSDRARYEPLYETTQIKGDGESHPYLSPSDEFADFETWDNANLDGTVLKTDDMLAGEYAREALKRGLLIEREQGINPYKFGLIGATDTHTSLATAEEENFFGKNSVDEPNPDRMHYQLRKTGDRVLNSWQNSASGYTAVWAEDNTREAIFDAMLRKEVYATTGPRITVRMFGGWEFSSKDLNSRVLAAMGYKKGVPMGGDLRKKPDEAQSPSFLVYALRDPIGANLDRIQIVKGWLDNDGATHENVYDVVWSDERSLDTSGKLPTVGNTVDVENATWTNSIGAPELGTVWTDPDFDPAQEAFYYTRVIEIPTPRWTTYDAYRFGTEIPDGAPVSLQERAYSSPIWYNPK